MFGNGDVKRWYVLEMGFSIGFCSYIFTVCNTRLQRYWPGNWWHVSV